MNCQQTITRPSQNCNLGFLTSVRNTFMTMQQLLSIAMLAVTATVVQAAPGLQPNLENARATVAKWVETQQLIFKEKRDWQQGKELLSARIELVRNEIASLDDKIKASGDIATDTDAQNEALLAQNELLKQAGQTLAADLAELEQDVRKLHAVLPEAIQAKLHPLYQRLPQDPAHTKASLAERYQNVLGILNEITKFNSEITITSEVRTLADGKPAEVKTVYVGLGQAYFLSAKGEAGIGRPTAHGWQWQPAKGIASSVLTVIEILQNKSHPAFVPLPVKLQ